MKSLNKTTKIMAIAILSIGFHSFMYSEIERKDVKDPIIDNTNGIKENILFTFMKERMFLKSMGKFLAKSCNDCEVYEQIKSLPFEMLFLKLHNELLYLSYMEESYFAFLSPMELKNEQLSFIRALLVEKEQPKAIHLEGLRLWKKFCKQSNISLPELCLPNTLILFSLLEEYANTVLNLQLATTEGKSMDTSESENLSSILVDALTKHQIFLEQNKDVLKKIDQFADSGCGFEFKEKNLLVDWLMPSQEIKIIKNFSEIMSYYEQTFLEQEDVYTTLIFIRELILKEPTDTSLKEKILPEKILPLLTHARWKVRRNGMSYIHNLAAKKLIDKSFLENLELAPKIKSLLADDNWEIQWESLGCIRILSAIGLVDRAFVDNLQLEQTMVPLLMHPRKLVQRDALACLELLLEKELIDKNLIDSLQKENGISQLVSKVLSEIRENQMNKIEKSRKVDETNQVAKSSNVFSVLKEKFDEILTMLYTTDQSEL